MSKGGGGRFFLKHFIKAEIRLGHLKIPEHLDDIHIKTILEKSVTCHTNLIALFVIALLNTSIC